MYGNIGSELRASWSAVGSGASQIPTFADRPGMRRMTPGSSTPSHAHVRVPQFFADRIGEFRRKRDLDLYKELHGNSAPPARTDI
jgi:hypothetical protein